MESVCAGEGFYQRLTLTGIPVWDCTSNSCVPQEAAHKKQPKTPEDISHVASRLAGSTARIHRRGFYVSPSARALKEAGIMGESTNNLPVRRRVPLAAAEPARAHAPDDAKQPG